MFLPCSFQGVSQRLLQASAATCAAMAVALVKWAVALLGLTASVASNLKHTERKLGREG